MKLQLICVSILACAALVKANLPVKLEDGQIRDGQFWEVNIPLGATHGGKAGEKFWIWLDFGDKGLKVRNDDLGEAIGFGLSGGEGDGRLHAPSNNDPMNWNWMFKRVSGPIATNPIGGPGAIREDGEASGGAQVDLTSSMFVTCAIKLTITVPAGFEADKKWDPTSLMLRITAGGFDIVDCPSGPAMYDDPHIETWGGELFGKNA